MPSARQPATSEVALAEVLKTLLSDDELSDVTLEGTDGVRIGAQRCILAARSTVFRRMLFGDFAEGGSAVVRLGHDGRVLRAIVQYCYTNGASLFDVDRCDDSWARTVVKVVVAADYFHLPGLAEKAGILVESKMGDDPLLAFPLFDEAERAAGNSARVLYDAALATLRTRLRAALLLPSSSNSMGVGALGPSALEKILQDTEMNTDELTMFRALKQWADSEDEPPKTSGEVEVSVVSGGNNCKRKRRQVASGLVRNISLKRIRASDLCGVVQPSGLVTANELAEAFKEQALLFERTIRVTIPTCRGPCWDVSQDALLECRENCILTSLLEGGAMTSGGVYTWKIQVVSLASELGTYDEIGVACKVPSREDWLTSDKNTAWVFHREGCAYCPDSAEVGHAPTFAEGSVVRFTLDLTSSGSLSASVDGNEAVELFDEMLIAVDGLSFVPAVSIYNEAAIRFLGFENRA